MKAEVAACGGNEAKAASHVARPDIKFPAAALASAEDIAMIAEEAPVLIPIFATGVKELVDLVRNDAPALEAHARTLAASLKAPDAIQATPANDDWANLLARGAIWVEQRFASAIASTEQPTVTSTV